MHDLVLHAAKAAFRLRISDRRTSKGCMACLDSLPPNRKNEPLCCTLQNAYLYRLLDAKVGMVLAAGLIARLVDRPGRDDGVRRPLSGGDVIQCHTRHAVESSTADAAMEPPHLTTQALFSPRCSCSANQTHLQEQCITSFTGL